MAGDALKDLKNLPVSERKSDCKGGLTKPGVEKVNEKAEERASQNSTSSDTNHLNGVETQKTEAERAAVEVEYIESEELNDIEDADSVLTSLVPQLDSKDWVSVCDALNNVRRMSIYHKEAMMHMLEKVIPLVVKSLKNPRSAVCKTACMTSADIFSAYSDHILDLLDPLLTQLLLKSSQDKRFVCEAAEKALVALTTYICPSLLLPKLQPCLKHKNPRIRAKAAMCFSRSVPRLGVEGVKEYGMEKLIQAAASQLSDQLPESREAARTALLELQSVCEKSQPVPVETPTDEAEAAPAWEALCKTNLSALSAQAVLRVTNPASREGLVTSNS